MLSATEEQIQQAPNAAELYPAQVVFARVDRVKLSNEVAYGYWAPSAEAALLTCTPAARLDSHQYEFYVVPPELCAYPLLRAEPNRKWVVERDAPQKQDGTNH